MQDITTLAFMRIIARHGAPDWFVTEFIRVHAASTPNPDILDSLERNDTGRPVFAQLIGESPEHMARTASSLLKKRGNPIRSFGPGAQSQANSRNPSGAGHSVAGIDLNLGCPVPKVFRKNVGGGLLRDLHRVDILLDALRSATAGRLFTVKTRTGFDNSEYFPTLLELINLHDVDLLTVHGRTVRGLYRSPVDYEAIALAVRTVQCPVVANGDITSAEKAVQVLKQTGCAGLMVGRHAVRNPWIFRQIRERLAGLPVFQPCFGDVRAYVDELVAATATSEASSERHAARMKKFLNFVGVSVDPDGAFLDAMRRAPDLDTLLRVCDAHLTENGRATHPFPQEPYETVLARPNYENQEDMG
jgi:tRNA-dihydrouridine synthase